MQKTKLGVSVGMLGALMFLVTYFGGIIPAVICAGYIFLCEENAWLKKSAAKALMLTLCISFATSVVHLIPDALGLVSSILGLIKLDFGYSFISRLVNIISSALSLIKTLLFLGLTLKAFNQGTIKVPVVDDIVNKNIADAE